MSKRLLAVFLFLCFFSNLLLQVKAEKNTSSEITSFDYSFFGSDLISYDDEDDDDDDDWDDEDDLKQLSAKKDKETKKKKKKKGKGKKKKSKE